MPIVFHPRHPHVATKASSGSPEALPKNGDVPSSPLPQFAALLPSAGILFLEIHRYVRARRCRWHPASVRYRGRLYLSITKQETTMNRRNILSLSVITALCL